MMNGSRDIVMGFPMENRSKLCIQKHHTGQDTDEGLPLPTAYRIVRPLLSVWCYPNDVRNVWII